MNKKYDCVAEMRKARDQLTELLLSNPDQFKNELDEAMRKFQAH